MADSPSSGGAPVAEKPPLDDLMLAMDVVDTLRHRQRLVERELSAEQREQDLSERIREIYAEQGIEVPEHIVAEGVAALREERFAYTPPAATLQVRLARLYVNRGAWAKRLAVVAVLGLALWGAWYLLVTRPAQQELEFAIGEINGRIMLNEQQIDQADERADVLARELAAVSAVEESVATLLARGEARLRDARRLIAEARTLDQEPDINASNLDSRGDAAREQAYEQQTLADNADQVLDEVAATLADVNAMAALPEQLDAARDRVLDVARVGEARQSAEQLWSTARFALRGGDVAGARQGLSALDELADRLERTYTLRIVSRPGVRSGVWRVPDGNQSARNYYLIVEAIDPSGRTLALPVTSEETGQTETVDVWGLRVSERAFDRVRADKSDDGIIQNDVLGRKERGYLEPEYTMDTTGGAITRW